MDIMVKKKNFKGFKINIDNTFYFHIPNPKMSLANYFDNINVVLSTQMKPIACLTVFHNSYSSVTHNKDFTFPTDRKNFVFDKEI